MGGTKTTSGGGVSSLDSQNLLDCNNIADALEECIHEAFAEADTMFQNMFEKLSK